MFAVIALMVAVGARAQSILEFDRWMQAIERKSQSVQRDLASRNAEAATADAREIGELYGRLEQFFLQRDDAASAVQLSRQGKELSASVIRAIAAGDFVAASSAALAVARACRDCHFEYKPLK
jgi:hypothetical protein